LTKGKL